MRRWKCRRSPRRPGAVLLAAIFLAAAPGVSFAASVTLAWDPNSEPDLEGYKLHYGLSKDTYTVHRDVGKVTSYTATGLADGARYYFAVTAYDGNRNESGYSNEVSYPELVSRPTPPEGATAVADRAARTYATGGAASTAGHPIQYRLLWADGTVSPWLSVGSAEAAKSWSFPGTYAVRSEARCAPHPTVVSNPSGPLAVQVVAAPDEVIPAPSAPAGPGNGLTGLVYGYATDGAGASTGDPLQLRFQWGDGTASPWFAPGASGIVKAWKSWPAGGVYSIVAEARCALHPSFPALSPPSAVAIAGGSSLLLSDSFSDGTTAGDPQWRTLSGRWLVGADRTFASANRAAVNRAVVRALPDFAGGRIRTKIRLTADAVANGAGIVFALADTRQYRYVLIRGSRIVLGQVGESPGATAGVKAVALRRFRADRWYQLRTDVHLDGRVFLYIDKETKPVLTYRFNDAKTGSIGCLAQKCVAHFDDFRAWDARALP